MDIKSTFTLTVVATNGTVKKTPDLPQYDSGSSVGLKATANTGYRFVNWSGDVTGTTDSTTIILSKGKNITANFELITYQLTVAAVNGNISTPATPTITVNYGTLTPIKAVANTGYSFSKWTVTTGTAAITSATTDSTTVSLTNGNATVTANFTAKPVGLTLTTNGQGTTTPVNSATGNYGIPINISASPSSGYSFSSWELTSGNATIGNETQATTTATLTSDATIKANFTPNALTLTMTNDGHGTTTPAATATTSYGVAFSISATPSAGYSFSNWTVTTGTATFVNSNSSATTVTLTASTTIRANFTANPVTLTLTNDGHGSTTPSSSTSGSHGVPISISATPSSGYRFSNWTITPGTAGTIANTTSASTSVTLTSATATIRANFLPIDYTITYNYDNGSGSNPSTYNISQTPVTLGDAIKTGFTFVGWFDNQSLTGNKVTSIPSGSTGPKSFWAKWVVMDRDGNTYDTVIINGVTWMKSNLITGTLSNGTKIMKDYPSDWSSAQNPQCCYYNFDSNNGRIHGALYNASAAKSSMLAPEGWHVATKEEWKALVPNTNIASELASIYFWQGIGTNTTGFSATPGGAIGCDGLSAELGDIGYWWTSTTGTLLNFVQFGLVHGMIGYDVTESTSECNGYSIRCVLNH